MGSWQCEEGCCRTRDECGIGLNRWTYWLPCTSWIIHRKGKRMTSLNDMLRNTIEIPGITFGKWQYFKTLWNYLTHPPHEQSSEMLWINSDTYSFIIFDTSVKHLLQAMSHAPWFMAHDSSRARSVHSHPLVHVLWLNRLRQTFENMSAVLGF